MVFLPFSRQGTNEIVWHGAPTVVSHLVLVVGLCTDDPKDF